MSSALTSEPDRSAASAAAIWRRLAPAASGLDALDALLGLGANRGSSLLDETTLSSPEIHQFLHALPSLLREPELGVSEVRTSTTGGVRGPVQWSETLSARSASGGAAGVYVYTESHRTTDTPLNRVLVSTLEQLVALADRVLASPTSARPELAAEAAETGRGALAHNAMAPLRDRRRTRRHPVSRRDTVRARSSRAASRYEPVLRASERIATPLGTAACAELSGSAEPATRSRLVLLHATLEAIDRRHRGLAPLVVRGTGLATGPVRYWPDRVDERGAIALGDVVIDRGSEAGAKPLQPEIHRLATHGPTVTVDDPDQLERVLDLAEQRLRG